MEHPMYVTLTQDELIQAVKDYLKPKMGQFEVNDVQVREVRIQNSKQMEVRAKLEEKKGKKK